jgi:phage replication-related protein YjqB (UPF0714/DUF867 family)
MWSFLGIGPYRDFAALARREREGVDWERHVAARDSAILVASPHGGGIEAGTSEIAAALAGEEFALYDFRSTKPDGNARMHITSTRFDDPVFLEMAARSRVVVTLHGCAGEAPMVFLGGLHEELRRRVGAALAAARFDARSNDPRYPGEDPRNICNRGRDGRGVQLELTRGLRRTMFAGLSAVGRRRSSSWRPPRKTIGASPAQPWIVTTTRERAAISRKTGSSNRVLVTCMRAFPPGFVLRKS